MKRNLSVFLVCLLATLIPAFAQKATTNPVKLFTKSLGNDQVAELYSNGTWKRVQYFTKFENLYPMGGGLFMAYKGEKNEIMGLVDKTGKEIVPMGTSFNILLNEDRITMTKYHGSGNYTSIVLDTNGREVFRNKYLLSDFCEGMASAFVDSDSHMYVDKWGNPISDRYYGLPQGFSEGMAAVNKYGKWGFIDKTGRLVIPFEYEMLKLNHMRFREGVAVVGKNGKYGVIDKKGNEIVPFKYENALAHYSEGLLSLKENDKWGVIDKRGNIVVPFEFDYIDEYHSGLAGVNKNDKYGFIDRTGKLIIPCIYFYVEKFTDDGVAVCKRNRDDDKTLLINKQGQEIAPGVYDAFGRGGDGLVEARKGEKWGYINPQGKVIIPFKYSSTTRFVDGMAVVKDKDNHLFIIDKQGKVVSSFAPKYIPINQK